jgi:hypothetical protein
MRTSIWHHRNRSHVCMRADWHVSWRAQTHARDRLAADSVPLHICCCSVKRGRRISHARWRDHSHRKGARGSFRARTRRGRSMRAHLFLQQRIPAGCDEIAMLLVLRVPLRSAAVCSGIAGCLPPSALRWCKLNAQVHHRRRSLVPPQVWHLPRERQRPYRPPNQPRHKMYLAALMGHFDGFDHLPLCAVPLLCLRLAASGAPGVWLVVPPLACVQQRELPSEASCASRPGRRTSWGRLRHAVLSLLVRSSFWGYQESGTQTVRSVMITVSTSS